MAETSGRESEGRALIFFRHVYYLRVPYAYGHPDASRAMNPEVPYTDDVWDSLFRNQHIRWVVRAPDYPESRNTVLKRLESEKFVQCATGTVEDWAGNRIGGTRELQPIPILCPELTCRK